MCIVPPALSALLQDDASGLYDMDGEDEVWLKLYNERVCR
jgi:hypothetical protein